MFGVVWSLLTGGLTSVVSGFGKVLRWLIANPGVFLALGFCVAFVLVMLSKNHEITVLQKEVTERDKRNNTLTLALTQSHANVTALSSALDQQNNSILALRAQGDAASGRFDQIMLTMSNANASTAKKLTALDKAKPGADKCASALALIRSNAQ